MDKVGFSVSSLVNESPFHYKAIYFDFPCAPKLKAKESGNTMAPSAMATADSILSPMSMGCQRPLTAVV